MNHHESIETPSPKLIIQIKQTIIHAKLDMGSRNVDFCRSCSMPMMNWHWSFCPGSASNPTNTPSNKQISTKPESIEAKFCVFLLESAPKLRKFSHDFDHKLLGSMWLVYMITIDYLPFLDFFWDKNVGQQIYITLNVPGWIRSLNNLTPRKPSVIPVIPTWVLEVPTEGVPSELGCSKRWKIPKHSKCGV